MYLLHRVEEAVARYTDARQAVGAFILREHAHLSDYTIADIAEQTYTSKASVTRFAQSLGFDGWRNFIKAFMAEEHYGATHPTLVDPNFPFKADDTDARIADAVADLTAEAIADTMRCLNHQALAKAVRHLENARSIWVMGLSPNIYLGQLFCRKLLSIGKAAHTMTAGEYGLISRTLTSRDCVIMISYSGDNPHATPMRHIPTLVSRRVPIIGITSEGQNYLRRNASCTLTISSFENLYAKISTMATEASITYLLDVLFSCFFARDYAANLAFKVDNGKALETERKSLAEPSPSPTAQPSR